MSNNFGFVRVASAIPAVEVANCSFNQEQMLALIKKATEEKVQVLCFPELSITSYTCQDLFIQQKLLDDAEMALKKLLEATKDIPVTIIVGMPVAFQNMLLNCAVVIKQGIIQGIVPKNYLPNYKEFYEMRWFASGHNIPNASTTLAGQNSPIGHHLLFDEGNFVFGIEICEDMWAPAPPSTELALHGADVIFNLSADNDCVGKYTYLKSLIAQQSARCLCGYVFAGAGFGESTQDIVFSGKALIYENGRLLAESERFSMEEQLITTEIDIELIRTERRSNTTFSTAVSRLTDNSDYKTICIAQTSDRPTNIGKLHRTFPAHPFVPTGNALDERCEEIFHIQMHGLAKRLLHTRCSHVVVGISGGLDSTLALLVCVRTFDSLKMDRKGIVGITMPGMGTTDRTYSNAIALMQELGITLREISIVDAVKQHFKDLDIDSNVHDVTYENSQARERTQILMDAANQVGGLVIGTGDLSELALGWATYNGDHMSMYGVNVSVPKTLVRHLVEWTAKTQVSDKCREVLLDVAATPISPELIPADENGNILQKTEDLVGPYELHDFFLYFFLRFGFRPQKLYFMAQQTFAGIYSEAEIKKWITVFMRRFFTQQFKRSCLPDGPKVGNCSLSPRGDWRMPSDASSSSWVDECKLL